MRIQNLFLSFIFLLSTLIIFCSFRIDTCLEDKIQDEIEKHNTELGIQPSSLLMYQHLEKYSKEYEVPKYIAYNIAFLETRYQGPFDWNYNPNRVSSAGALGPMQILPSTANFIHQEKVSTKKVKTDIEFNIKTSMIILNKLYQKYEDWGKVCGYYNTGYPIVNGYAKFCIKNLDYQKNWVNI